MIVKSIEAVILLYPSKTQSMKELRQSLGDFCKEWNITIIDMISLADEYDYLALRRLSQIITYRRKPIALVTNRSILATAPPLTLWSILEAINSTKLEELTHGFLRDLKETSNKLGNQSPEDFRIFSHKEVERMSDDLEHIQDSIIRE